MSRPASSKRDVAMATLTRPAADGQDSVAPPGVFLGDLTDAPDSGMRTGNGYGYGSGNGDGYGYGNGNGNGC